MGERIEVDGPWERVEKKYLYVDLVSSLIGGLILTIAAGVITYFASSQNWVIIGIVAGITLAWMVLQAVLSFFRTRTIGYRLRDDDLLVRRGMLFRRFVAVPYGRMQIVDIEQGPLERMFGLKKLKFVTAAAASAVVLPGLSDQRAEELRDELVTVAESRRAGL
ncbi:PH domain-containing protein [uncultured Agrococcus sp.]|uniref:PH domain-containing protein n=1 Tax=uncultured Agrococcus sp. TaxID=382258 RepID=UPI0025E68AF2|nr:PH domain-containing protein [uncultured Agrococcus sp.]